MRTRTHEKIARPKLSDIAQSAGVSTSTVSLVLAGKAKERYISDDVIDRVRRTAAEMDYSPNMLVRSLQQGRTNIFSFFNCFRYSQSPTDLYTMGLFTSSSRAAGSIGCNLLLFCDFAPTSQETYHALKGGHSDGVIIFAPKPDDPLLLLLRSSRLPTVLLNSEDPLNALSSVKDDVVSGIDSIARHLIGLGHRKIALFTSNTAWNSDAQVRVALLLNALNLAGIAVPQEWIIPVSLEKEDVQAAAKSLFAHPDPPTAIFCWDDYLGYVLLDVCEDLNIDVPRQLSVVGYDGIKWPTHTHHVLASVLVDLNALGAHAVDILSKIAYYGEASPINRVLGVTFDKGTTLGAPSA